MQQSNQQITFRVHFFGKIQLRIFVSKKGHVPKFSVLRQHC